jgi:hypothetical protein
MSEIRLTKAQEKALDWLPADGAWRSDAGRLERAAHSLWLYHRVFVDSRSGLFGPRNGWKIQYRLTPAGIAFKAAREGTPR